MLLRIDRQHLVKGLRIVDEARFTKRTAGAPQGRRIQAQQRAESRLGVIAHALVIAGTDQHAVEPEGVRAGSAKMAAAQEAVIDPAKSMGQRLAESAGVNRSFDNAHIVVGLRPRLRPPIHQGCRRERAAPALQAPSCK